MVFVQVNLVSVGDMDNISSFSFEDFDPFALPFVLASQKSKLPPCPGIYFAIGGARTILYIGSAKNIRSRWRNHNVYLFLVMAMVDARIAQAYGTRCWLFARF